jgi:hypothetical protein
MAWAGKPRAMRSSTAEVNSPTTSGRSSLAIPATGPAATWWTTTPGSTSTMAGWAGDDARV